MQKPVSRWGVGLFGLVLVAWMYFGFALDLQHRAAAMRHAAAPAVDPLMLPSSIEDTFCFPSFVTVPPSVEDMIRLPAQGAAAHQPSIEDLANLPALAQAISVPPVVDELVALPRGRGPLSGSIIIRPTPTPTRRVIDRDQIGDPRARRRALELEGLFRRATSTPTPTPR